MVFILVIGIFYSFRLGFKLVQLSLIRKNHFRNTEIGKTLAAFCEEAGSAFLKIGQILSTRYDLLPEETITVLQKLQDNVRPFDSRKIEGIIERNFQKQLKDIFTEFDLEPIASASIAQVHRAVLRGDGREVAVKILRPGIKNLYRDDLFLINLGVRVLKKIPPFKKIPLEESFLQIAECLSQQTDFLSEAESNRKFQTAFSNQPAIKFPLLIDKFCTAEVLTMEYFDDLIKIDETSLSSDQREEIIIQCLEALYQMIFIEGFVHCDLHPGNFFYHRQNSLIILDTGFVAELNQNIKAAFREFFIKIVFKDAPACAKIIIEMSLHRQQNLDRSDFVDEIRQLLNKISNLPAKHFQISKFVLSLFEIQRKHGLYSTSDFTLPILSLLVFEGSIKKYHPDLNFQKLAIPFLVHSHQ